MFMSAYAAVPDSIILAIGKIAIECAAMDYFLAMAAIRVSGMPECDIEQFLGSDTRRKNKLFEESDQHDIVKYLSSAVEGILQDRNMIIHGVSVQVDDEKGFLAFRGKYKNKPIAHNEEALTQFANHIALINNRLIFVATTSVWPPIERQPWLDNI